MSDNIIIRLTAESELDNANAELQALQDREKDLRMEMLKSQAEYQKQNASIQATVKGREAQIAALDKLRNKHTEYQRSLETEQKKVKTSMDQYNTSLKNVNDTVADSAVKTPKLTTQIRLLKDELAKMEASGVSPSDKSFVKLAVNAARLEDQMGDTQQRVRILASDTKNLDAAMGIGQGLAGGFTAATSAAALLGGESEELQKAFFKVQAVMSILNGVNQVAIALNKDSAARVVIGTAIENSNTIAKIKNYSATKIQSATTAIETAVQGKGTVARAGATAAQWLLNAAMYAFPIVAIVAGLAAITVGLIAWGRNNKAAKERQLEFNNTLNETKRLMDAISQDTEFYTGLAQAEGQSAKNIISIRRQYAKDALNVATKNREELESLYNEASKSERKKLKDGLDEAKQIEKDALKDLNKVNQDATFLDVQTKTDAEKAKTERQKKEAEDRKKIAEKEAADAKALMIETQNAVDASLNHQSDAYKNYLLSQQVAFNGLKKQEITEEESFVESWLTILDRRKQLGLLSEADFLQQKLNYLIQSNASEEAISQAKFDIEKQRRDKELEDIQKAEERKQSIISASVDLISNIGNALFDLKKQQLDQELSDLEHYYTTDAEEAKNNKDKKLISEKDLERKKLDIRIKQAKADKAQALFNIGIDTLVAAISSLRVDPTGILAAIITASGLVSAGVVAAKQLPKYAKGKKAGGKGHFATVGELGAETMWVPDGAAIIPHNKPINLDTFADFNIPTIAGLGDKYIRGGEIDYNKLGRAVADNIHIPTPKPVTVNVDKHGITTRDGLMTVTHLNKKYTGAWS